jgi:hypothetical protein
MTAENCTMKARETILSYLRIKIQYFSYVPLTSWIYMTHVEAELNTSTEALRVVKGNEKGTSCLGV